MKSQIKISAKSLGELALPSFCPRCFWLKLHAQKLPFQIFPGIFSSIDSYSKKVTRAHFECHGDLLRWFKEFGLEGEPVKVPHYRQFQVQEEKSGVLLSGSPDEILHLKDGSYAILDYKTSKFSKTQDSLYPMYETQLNAYAYIGLHNGFSPISQLVLVYYEPITDMTDQQIEQLIHEEGFDMIFLGNLRSVDLNVAMIEPMLGEVRRLFDQASPPQGREGCPDCQSLDQLVELLSL